MPVFHLTYRKAQASDVPFLLDLRKDSMEEHLIRAGISTREEEHLKRIHYQFEFAQIIMLANQEIGLLKTITKADYVEIVQFQISSSYRGKGYGRQVVNKVMRDARSKNLIVCLSVLKENKAMRLYKDMGFSIVKETEDSFYMEAIE